MCIRASSSSSSSSTADAAAEAGKARTRTQTRRHICSLILLRTKSLYRVTARATVNSAGHSNVADLIVSLALHGTLREMCLIVAHHIYLLTYLFHVRLTIFNSFPLSVFM